MKRRPVAGRGEEGGGVNLKAKPSGERGEVCVLCALAMTSLTTVEQGKAEYLYWKYRQVLFTCAIKIVKDEILAEDVVQNTFTAVFQHLDAIEDCDSKSTAKYLITAAKNFAYQEYNERKKDELQTVDIDEQADWLIGDGDVWDTVKNRADQEELLDAFRRLNDGHRLLLIGKYYMGYSYRELAEMVKTTENGVSTRIVLAKRKLAKLLNIEGGGNA